jgi:translation initiation factor IF-3
LRPDQKDSRKGAHRVNWEIKTREVRVIDDEGAMKGVFPVNIAIAMAQEKGMELIEVAPEAKPPTCKIMDYGKYKYELKKKAQESKKKQVVIDTKEIQVRPRTDQHDIETKLKHSRRFLMEGDKVKVNLRFKGREIAHSEHGKEVLDKFVDALKDVAIIESPPKFEGKQYFLILAPDMTKIKEIKRKIEKEQGSQKPVKEVPVDETDSASEEPLAT